MNAQIEELIRRHEKKGDFTHAAPGKETLAQTEQELGIRIPTQFIKYLDKYSHGGIGGIEILGIGLDGSVSFLEESLEYRKEGLPSNLLVVENCDEWLYCIDCDTEEVVSWSPYEDATVEYSCFDEYLLDRLNDAAENM